VLPLLCVIPVMPGTRYRQVEPNALLMLCINAELGVKLAQGTIIAPIAWLATCYSQITVAELVQQDAHHAHKWTLVWTALNAWIPTTWLKARSDNHTLAQVAPQTLLDGLDAQPLSTQLHSSLHNALIITSFKTELVLHMPPQMQTSASTHALYNKFHMCKDHPRFLC
jgi:hypothetical protein